MDFSPEYKQGYAAGYKDGHRDNILKGTDVDSVAEAFLVLSRTQRDRCLKKIKKRVN